MNISLNTSCYENLSPASREAVEEKLAPIARLLGEDAATALLDLEMEPAPPEGRSATPTRLVANLTFGSTVLHTEAVKPSPERAADRVRRTLEAEIRHVRGKGGGLFKKGAKRLKDALRFGH